VKQKSSQQAFFNVSIQTALGEVSQVVLVMMENGIVGNTFTCIGACHHEIRGL